MIVSVSDAKGQLTDLVRRAEAGEEVVLTRHGHPTVRLTPVGATNIGPEQRVRRRMLLMALQGSGRGEFGPDASHAADFLYDDLGLPA